MAIIKQCCCGWTLRKGCYASATFSLIYFFLFTWITGSMTVGKIQPLFTDPEIYDDTNHGGGFDGRDANQIRHTNLHEDNHSNTITEHENHHQQQRHNIPNRQQQGHIMGRTSSVTSVPSSSYSEAGNESGLQTNTTKRMSAPSPSHHSYNDFEDFELDRENNSVSMLRLFLFSDTYSMVQTVNLVLDLLCEVAGVYSSILLIRGLQQDKKSWFWPWMIVVPTHIAIDAITMGGIMMEYFLQPMETPLSLVLLTVTVDVTLNSINAYGLICVISQYQEYKAGRGTAAYVEFTSQTPTILLETASSTKTVLNKPIAIPPQTRRKSTKDYSSSRVYNDKSDTYCEEISLQTMSHTNEKQALTDRHLVTATRNGNVHHKTVKNGQAAILSLDGECATACAPSQQPPPPPPPSMNNNSSSERGRRASAPSTGNKVGSPSGRFGKYLDVAQKRRASNLADFDLDDYSNEFIDADKIASMPFNNMKGISWTREQSDSTRSDSDSEDPTVDALSAFGIRSCKSK